MPPVSAVIIVRNEESRIRRCLEPLASCTDEIIVVDSMSADRTAVICREAGCRVFSREFDGYGSQKQFAVDVAVNDWVLSVDADEVITPGLASEINDLRKKGEPGYDAYEIPFSLVYMGRELKHGGVGKEKHLRLFNRKKGRFTNTPVHEGVVTEGKTGRLKNRILHYSYRDTEHHLEKINIYTSQAASGLAGKKKKFPFILTFFKFPLSFVSVYLVKGGIFDGYPGFVWSFLSAFHSTMKQIKTRELTSTDEPA